MFTVLIRNIISTRFLLNCSLPEASKTVQKQVRQTEEALPDRSRSLFWMAKHNFEAFKTTPKPYFGGQTAHHSPLTQYHTLDTKLATHYPLLITCHLLPTTYYLLQINILAFSAASLMQQQSIIRYIKTIRVTKSSSRLYFAAHGSIRQGNFPSRRLIF